MPCTKPQGLDKFYHIRPLVEKQVEVLTVEHNWPLGDLDTAGFRLSCAVNALGAVHNAMENGPFTAEGYVDALYSVYDHLQNVTSEILDCIQACFEEQKNRKEVGGGECASGV